MGLRNLKNFKVHIIIEEWNTKLEVRKYYRCVLCERKREGEERQRHIQKHTIILDNL